MKRWSLVLLALTISGLLFAQGEVSINGGHTRYDIRKTLPVDIVEAYSLAAGRLGAATNRFHCVSASCREPIYYASSAWVFQFSNTNGDLAQVQVFFNKDVYIDPGSAELLK